MKRYFFVITSALKHFAHKLTPVNGFAGAVSISSLTGAADAFAALTLAEGPRVVLAVTPGLPDADRLADDLRLLTAKTPHRILEFPPLLDGEKSALGTRLKTRAALKAWSLAPYPCVVVASFPAVMTPLPAGGDEGVRVSEGTSVTWSELVKRLNEMGYKRMPAVEQEGDFSVRGGIVDAWCPGEEFPVRAEFFGEDLESLRLFDAATQRSIERRTEASFLPIQEAAAGEESSRTTTIFDLMPPGAALLALEHAAYTLPEETNFSLSLYTGDPPPRGVPTHRFQTAPLPGFAELGADEAHHPELFDAARARLTRHLATAEQRGDLICSLDDLSGGFEIPGLLVVTKADRVFAKRKTRAARAAPTGARLADFDDLDPGEYVVHVDYGVGRFVGSSEILVDGKRSEVFTVEYADGATLHVPSAHAHLLSRYVGVKGEEVKLHRLDGKRWNKDKAAAQQAVADLAAALLDTQAKRELVPGFMYQVHPDGRDAFDAAFPYEETPDQLAAIQAIEGDLASSKPMDRLVCGDAGYGKTEVAMRAAFIAAMNGRQTVVLAPTTILAEQHFETFTARFDGTPVRIESVSRFQSVATHQGTFQRLASGVCDIVIGTHAILSPKVVFKDLGLIIIDEEQRFGVRQKEFLKNLRATADVLTLSATPIPRTLYLSMTGARDLSLLRSPPRARVAVETTVVRDSDTIVQAAIEAERARGGQVFFLHNRVTTIHKVEKRLRALLPDLRIVVAHGQMDARELARKMRDFERGKYDLLLSTTIIESGIDIPRANTILIHDAHMFGLADLYQLRGRVGRAAKQGRAIFLLPADGLVDSDARERLAALKRHGGLGAGFNLAVRDLELRGAGNLLGSQQSGHIAAVGFSLYCRLLQRTIALMKGEQVTDPIDVRLNLDFIDLSPASEDANAAAALPYEYVEEDAQRIQLMKRFAEVSNTRDVKALAAEIKDRFGPLPRPAARLVRLAELRARCAAAHIEHVDVRGTRAVFYAYGSRKIAFVGDLHTHTADRKLTELMRLVTNSKK